MNRLLVAGALTFSCLGAAIAQPAKMTPAPAAPPITTTTKPAADPWAGRTDLFVAPEVHTSTKVDLGDIQRYTLPNGLRVILVPRHSAPIVDVTIAVRLDETAEPLDKSGLSAFAATMLRKGTTKRTADQLSELVDTAGAELDANASDSGVYVSCRGRTRDLALCLDTSSDILLHPKFPAEEMDEVRSRFIGVAEQAQDDSQQLAQQHVANLFFGDKDQRGRPLSKRSITAIDRDTLLAFYKAWFHPNGSVIAVSGDFDPKTIRAQLARWFGGWPKGTAPVTTELAMPKSGPMKIRLVDRPDATQAQIAILGPGIRHADPDLCAVRLMNYSLGEGVFSSRLMKVVRAESAKTYGASTHFATHRTAGPFEAMTFTRESEVAATIKLVLGEIDKMKKSGPTAVELAAAKANLIGGYGLQFETASDVATQLIIAVDDDLPDDFITTYPACLDRVTLAEAAAAAKAHLDPQALVVVGGAAKLGPQLTAAKLAPKQTVSYTDPVSAAERFAEQTRAEEARRLAANAPPTEVEEGRKILKLALAAKGADSLAKIVDLHVVAKGTVSMETQKTSVDLDAYYAPAALQEREELTAGGGVQTTVLDGKKAFMKVGANIVDLPADKLAETKRDLWRNGNFVILNAAQEGVQVRALPPVTTKKVVYDVLNVVTQEGDSVELELDQKTHHVMRVAWNEGSQQQALVLSDYRNDGGIFFPHHVLQVNGPMRMELVVDKITLNKGLPKNAFGR